ncbi:MAG: hypothetical protein ABI647_15205 [Gemmatimonadota bacterium]
MRFCLCAIVVLAACGKGDKAPAADTTATAVAPPAPAPIALADVAGKWTLKTTVEGKDTTVTAALVATATTDGWTMTNPKQKPTPMRIRTDADSIMADAGPFPSVLMKGAMVTTNSVFHLQDGKLVGTMVARYTGAKVGADSVLRGRQEATRMP